jgi:hypothetical protein
MRKNPILSNRIKFQISTAVLVFLLVIVISGSGGKNIIK